MTLSTENNESLLGFIRNQLNISGITINERPRQNILGFYSNSMVIKASDPNNTYDKFGVLLLFEVKYKKDQKIV